jgi:hypothetical protein
MAGDGDNRRSPIDYASPDRRARFSVVAIMAFACIAVAISSTLLLVVPLPFYLPRWANVMLEVLEVFGPLLAIILGFRGMVVLEKEENQHLRGAWMAAAGLFGGAAIVLFFCLNAVRR